MKKIRFYALFCSMMLLFGGSVDCWAALINFSNPSGNVVYDDVAHQYWMNKLDSFTNLTFADQMDSVNAYNTNNYYGMHTWHMATYDDMLSIWVYSSEEITSKFNPSFTYPENITIAYDGRYVQAKEAGQHYYAGITVYEGVMTKSGLLDYWYPDNMGATFLGAWVVTDAAQVPVPASIILFGSGLISLMGIRRKTQKK